MGGSTTGRIFRLTTFGESHGKALGGIVDGCPAGLRLDESAVQHELDRRRPGQSKITTRRNEADCVRFLSGLFRGKTTGAPIAFIVYNEDQRPKDYSHLASAYRPSHAGFTYDSKYGHSDHRGGGRASARETLARVVAGAVARQLLERKGIVIRAWVSQVGDIVLEKPYQKLNLSKTDGTIVRCPDAAVAKRMIALIEKVRKAGDTVGGVVSAVVTGAPAGLGEPVFDKLHADLGKAMLGINAVKGFEYGSGFAGAAMRGSQHNDLFVKKGKRIGTKTNHSGGIQGGISNGEDICFRVAFKPVATIMRPQPSVNKKGQPVTVEGKGRHDPCVLPRAVPIVEAMAALTLADHYLLQKSVKL